MATVAATPARNWSGLGAREGEVTEGKRGGGRGDFIGRRKEGGRALIAGNREIALPCLTARFPAGGGRRSEVSVTSRPR